MLDLLKYVKRIDTPKHSIFYSFTKKDDKYIGFGRRSIYPDWRVRDITCVQTDSNFENMHETCVLRGEDPRVFLHNGKTYVVDNCIHDMHLYCIEDDTYTKIHIPGKNLTFISNDSRLYAVWSFMPFILVEIDISTGKVIGKLPVDKEYPMDYLLYRGGTPGYHLRDDIYYGFGHMTYIGQKHPSHPSDVYYHDPFLWIIKLDERPKLNIHVVHKPVNSLKLLDPTSILDGKLFSAECDTLWGGDADYVTNMYEVDTEKILKLSMQI